MAKIRISVQDITDLAAKALLNNGISEEDAIIIIAHLFDGELSGHPSHGFFRIPGIVNAAKKAPYPDEIKITKETAFSALLDGGMRQGLVVALDSTNIAIKKAKETKLAIVAGHNYVGTTGAMGYFTRKIADNGLIGVMIATSAEGVSPWGGTEMILGTNPISISIPRNGDPIVGDLATAAWSYGDLALAMLEGRHVPEGIVIDKDGNPSTNPHDADNGSQLPMAQHKGYVLGLAVEILAGPLIGAKAGVKAVKASGGFTMLALSPDVFVSADQFKTQVNALIDEIKSSQRRPGVDEILYPGEHSQKTRLANKNSEYIEILDQVVENVRTLAEVK